MNIERKCGKLITFEGPEGGGKSTHAAALADRLRAAGKTVKLTREPGGTWLGEGVRGLLKTHQQPAPSPVAELFLFLACRAQLVNEVMRPVLESGGYVIRDRFADSTVAYQGYGRNLPLEQVAAMNCLAVGGLEPDLTFLLDLDVEQGLRRASRRQDATGGETDRIERETLDFHQRVRQGYLDLARRNPGRFHHLDATRSPAELQEEIWSKVQRVIQS